MPATSFDLYIIIFIISIAVIYSIYYILSGILNFTKSKTTCTKCMDNTDTNKMKFKIKQ